MSSSDEGPVSAWDLIASENKKAPSLDALFPFEHVLDRVFEAADGILDLAFYLVGLALRLQLGVTGRLADRLLDCAFDLLR